jgi:hypothetical protein
MLRKQLLRNRRYAAVTIGAGILWLGSLMVAHKVDAQGQETYKARLALVPSDLKTRPDITGGGTATAVLSGTKLTVTGTFEGLKTPATMAELRAGIATAVRGPVIQTLTVTKGTSGSISGTADLTPAQVEGLKKNHFYVELYGEKTPEGNLWGWLLR